MILEKQYHDDLKKELQGVAYNSAGSTVEKETPTGEPTNVQGNVDDGADMTSLTMSRKKRKLYEAMKVNSSYPLCIFELPIS